MATSPLRVTIWNEYIHEQSVEQVRKLYPAGLHAVIGAALEEKLAEVLK